MIKSLILISLLVILSKQTADYDACVIGTGLSAMVYAKRLMDRSNGTARVAMFNNRPNIEDFGGVMNPMYPLKPTGNPLTKYPTTFGIDMLSGREDPIGMGFDFIPYHDLLFPEVEWSDFDLNPNVVVIKDQTTGEYASYTIIQGMTILLIPIPDRRTIDIEEEACFEFDSFINSEDTHFNPNIVPLGNCNKNIHFTTNFMKSKEELLQNFREKIKKNVKISINHDKKPPTRRSIKAMEKEEGFMAVPVFNVILQLMNMFPQVMDNIMAFQFTVLQLMLGDPSAPEFTYSQALNMFFPLGGENHDANYIIQKIFGIAVSMVSSEYQELHPFKWGKGLDYFVFMFYAPFHFPSGGTAVIKDYYIAKIREYGSQIKNNHPITEFLFKKDSYGNYIKNDKGEFVSDGIRARVCPNGDEDHPACIYKDFTCTYVVSSAPVNQNYKVIMPRDIQLELEYDELLSEVRGTQSYFVSEIYIDKGCSDFMENKAYLVSTSDYYPDRLVEYMSLSGDEAKSTKAPYWLISNSDRDSKFKELYPDKCTVRVLFGINTKIWDEWFGTKDYEQDPKFIHLKYLVFGKQAVDTLGDLFPNLDIETDIYASHFTTPVGADLIVNTGKDSFGNHIGCACGVSKSTLSDDITVKSYIGEKIWGTDIATIGKDMWWSGGVEPVASTANRASFITCKAEEAKEYPAFSCNDEPKYPDCAECY